MEYTQEQIAEAHQKFDLLREEMILRLKRVDRMYLDSTIAFALLIMHSEGVPTPIIVHFGNTIAKVLDVPVRQFSEDVRTTLDIMTEHAKAALNK